MPRLTLRNSPPMDGAYRLNNLSWQAKGLILWMPFIGHGGRAMDLGRNGIDGVFPGGSSNPTWTGTRDRGMALSFDGGDYLTITDGYTKTVRSDNNHTMSLWFYPRSFANLPMLLDSPGLGDLGCFIEVDSNNVYWGYNGALGYRQYAATPTLNAWNHLLVVKRSSGDNGDLYLNGIRETSWTRALDDPPSGTSDFVLGQYQVAGFEFDGMLSDFRVYDYGMSDSEAFQIWAPQTRWELYRPFKGRFVAPFVTTSEWVTAQAADGSWVSGSGASDTWVQGGGASDTWIEQGDAVAS